VRESSDRQRVALDVAVGAADGQSPARFLENYTRATRERDEARRALGDKSYNIDLLTTRSKALSEDLAALKTKLDDETKRADRNEKDAKEVADLRTRAADLKADNEKQARRLDELEEVADTVEGHRVSAVLQRYNTTWYAAVAGWAVAAVIGLLFASYSYFRLPMPGDDEPPPPQSTREEPPPHRIT
jgi:hypothetical protein